MTIDEVIAQARSDEEFFRRNAEWLEELKAIKEKRSYVQGFRAGYKVAIDDFVKLVHKHDWNIRNRNENSFIYGAIDTLAEQLKAGGDNDD